MEWLQLPQGQVGLDSTSGAITALRLAQPETEFIVRSDRRGLLRLAAPLSGYGAYFLETGVHGSPMVELGGDGLRLRYSELSSAGLALPISVEIDLTPAADGLVLRARVHNGWSDVIPQIVFPQIFGLGAIGGTDGARLQLGRGQLHPFRELTLRPDDAVYLDLGLYRYYGYGFSAFNMKWLDYGSAEAGFTLYARDPRYTLQGLLADRPDRADERLDLRWIHYPFVEPGETWESPEYVLLPHAGDWYAGARAYRQFAAAHYPYRAPARLREALGFRSIWLSYLNAPTMYRFVDLPDLAAEMRDLDLAEMCVWGWTTQFGYPFRVNLNVGTAEELAAAINRCQAMGVPVCLFTSHHLVVDGPETDPSWLHLNAARQRGVSNWTYNRDFLPRFGPLFVATHSAIMASALSPGWRKAGLEEYRRVLELGATSICFDQFFIWNEPNYNPARDGRPNEEGEKLLAFGERARELIHAANSEGTFSGEGVVDASVPVIDYTWEWRNGYDLAESGPFRYVFPHYRLNANVNEHPRGALLAFVEGALLNVMPGGMERRLRDCPALVATLRKLARLRRRFLHYFTEGQFHYLEGLRAAGCVARRYSHRGRTLVLATNPGDVAAQATLDLDPLTADEATAGMLYVYDLDGSELERRLCRPGGVHYTATVEPDGLRVLEIWPAGDECSTNA